MQIIIAGLLFDLIWLFVMCSVWSHNKEEQNQFWNSLSGIHNFINVSGVIACAKECGIETEYIKKGIESLESLNGRMEVSESVLANGKNVILIKYLDNGNIDIDVKGISNTELHNDFLSEIVSVILILEKSGIKDAINYLSVFIEKYLHYELPVTFYREFNSFSKYRINSNSNYIYNTFDYGIDATEKDKYNLDINYNYSILRELFSVLIEIYNIRIK